MTETRIPVRVNTRISARYNDWLDQRSVETSVSKSALINLAIENYIAQSEMTMNMREMLDKVEGLEQLQEQISDLKKQVQQLKNKKG